MYSALIKLEPELKAALDAEMDKQRVVTLGRLEGVLGQILSRLHRGDARASKIKQKMVTGAGPDVDFDLDSTQTAADNKADQLAPVVEQAVVAGEETSVEQPEAEDKAPEPLPETPEKEQAPETPPKSESEKLADVVPKEKAQSRGAPPPFAIQFMQLPPAEDGTQRRCQRLDKVITINIAHPDFLERASYRQQRLQMNDRLSSYLAEIIGMYYRDDELKNMMFGVQGSTSGQSSETYYERTLDVISRFEHVMKKNMKSLQTELDRSTKGMSHEAPTDASAEEAAEGDYGESSEDSPLFGETKKKTRKRASKRD
ncbi:hypothetical protein CAOG_02044 [Capsaspora owczarzaki ATCC 30864]|nr:hypothetical protein CAOG_02044 [Capsaspora owczarzaki ATCC 30864]|eukprot:XP_004348794.1 hypothetical protein CAOG_02044 [Capsaspora owczarzaki ATCC 30864]